MTKLAEQLKQGADHAWESLSEGWRELTARASGALTRFWPALAAPPGDGSTAAPETSLPRLAGWAFIGADVFDGDDRLVVRIEAPGMRREDFNVDVDGDALIVSGEKRFDRESLHGNWRVVQCAYGSFRREVPLPVPVKADAAKASYRDGVLRIQLPKAEGARARRITVQSY